MKKTKTTNSWPAIARRIEPATGSANAGPLSKTKQRTLEDILHDARQGQSVRVFFSGADEAKKIMTAQWLAAALRLDLYRVDLGAIAGKRGDEREKTLRRLVEAMADGKAILFLDAIEAFFARPAAVDGRPVLSAGAGIERLVEVLKACRGLLIYSGKDCFGLDTALLEQTHFDVRFPILKSRSA
jgi:hypothetical protein